MRKVYVGLMLSFVVLVLATPVFAQAEGDGTSVNWERVSFGFAMAIASGFCALAQGKAISAACEGLARNPGAAPAIRFALILGLVLIESLALYTLFIILIGGTL
jgi:F-type H+-transporting ATPase subunit c